MQLDNLYNMLPKEYDGSTECDKNCSESKQEIIKRFLMADVMASLSEVKLGTLIRQYSDKIGFSFTNQPLQYQKINIDNWSTCNAIGNIENLIFETDAMICAPNFFRETRAIRRRLKELHLLFCFIS